MSIKIAITNRTILKADQSPPYLLITTLYHSVVTGKKIKPSTGQRVELNTPENQSVKNHNTARSNLGNIRAIIASKQGISGSFWF